MLLLICAILAGQLVRIPLFGGTVTPLDIAVFSLSLFFLYQLKFKLTKPPKWVLVGLAFAFVSTLSLIQTPLHLTGSEVLNSFSYTVRFLTYVLFGWLVFQKGSNLKVLNALTVSGVALAIFGLFQFIFLPDLEFLAPQGWDPHFFRTVSTFLDPNFLGAYLILTLLVLFHLRGVNQANSKLHLGGVLLIYIALLTTFSRSSYLMFTVSFLILSLMSKSVKTALLTAVLTAILFGSFWLYTREVSEPRNIDRGHSAVARLSTWQQGLQILFKSPVLGVGFNSYKYALKEYQLADERFLKSHGATTNDSSLLYVAATTGVLGLAVFIYFLFSLIRSNPLKLLPALGGLLIHSLFANSLFYPPILLWIILLSLVKYEDWSHSSAG